MVALSDLWVLKSFWGTSPQRDDIDFGPCSETEGEHDGSDAIAHIEYLVPFGVGSRPFTIDMLDG